MKIVRRLMTGGALGLLLALSMNAAPVQAAAKYVVDEGNVNCVAGSGVADFISINAAVNFAKTHNTHTILVCPGAYNEFVTIDGFHTLKLAAAKKAPSSRPVIRPPGADGGAIITVSNKSTGIVLDGLVLDGSTFLEPSTTDMVGISVHNSSVVIQNTRISGLRNSAIAASPEGIGIKVVGSSSNKTYNVTLRNSYIFDYQTTGVWVTGRVKANVLDSRIDGQNGGTPPRVNGVWYQGAAAGSPQGSIARNVIQGNNTMVKIEEASKISVTGNQLEGALYISNHCSFAGAAANKNRVTGNTISHISVTGALYITADIDGSTVGGCNPTANNTLIMKNTISTISAGGTYVAYVNADLPAAGHTAQMKGAEFRSNKLFGFCCVVFVLGAANTPSVSGNIIIP